MASSSERSSEQDPGADWRASFHEAGPYLGLGMQLALTMAFFTLGGYGLDRWLDTLPWLTVAGALVGMAAVFVQNIRVTNELAAEDRREREAKAQGEPGARDVG